MKKILKLRTEQCQNINNLDTSIPKLRRKYANLKVEWRRLTDRWKNGSGLSPEELKWFCILNEVFSETNSEITLATSSQDLSFNLDVEYSADEDEDQREEDISDHDDGLEEDSAIEEQNKKKKTLVAPHKKRKIVRSQQQALSQLAVSVGQLASVQMKKHKLSLESDLQRDEMFLKFKQDKVKKTVRTNLKWQKFTQMQWCIKFDVLHQVRAVIVISKLPHKLLRHPLCLEIPTPPPATPPASYGYGRETQNYVHKQYPNTLYRPGYNKKGLFKLLMLCSQNLKVNCIKIINETHYKNCM